MNLRSFFRSDRLGPEWIYRTSGILWRILCTRSGRIVGECRDQERKAASFFCLDEHSGRPHWENLVLDQPWWVGLEGVQNDVALFHTYAQPDMPAHKGVYAHDLGTGRELWRNGEMTFWFSDEQRVYVYKDLFEKRVGYELDLKTGKLLNSFDDSLQSLHLLRRQAGENRTSDVVIVPEFFQGDSADQEAGHLVKAAMKGKLAAGMPEFIKHRDVFALSYYTARRSPGPERPRYDNTLSVYRMPGARVVFTGIIGSDLIAPVPDTFFMKESRLFFIQDQRALVALRLWQS